MSTSFDFDVFFREVHTWEPFPWQIELAAEVIERGWPEQLDLPTASGKTSVLDIAVFSLASQAADAQRRAPLRIFFVIDRRVVVDQAARHAKKLALALRASLDDPGKFPALHAVASRLSAFGGYTPLHVAVLRGGIYREPAWYYAPNQPLICLSTVDQVGSRLLFRGYGVSEAMRPVHAGLIGCDSLIIVDEAHVSTPFVNTVRNVGRYLGSAWAERPLSKPFATVELSATQRVGKSEPFRLHPKHDHEHPVLGPRLTASKRAFLECPVDFEKTAAQKATQLLAYDDVQVVGVIVNRVGSARAIFELLRTNLGIDVILVTGRARPYDREVLLEEWLALAASGRNRSQRLDRKLIVVATQTIEVGADLDFDALVTEAASLDALRQRFGRLDRLGERKVSRAWILMRRCEETDIPNDDPIYGPALARTWKWLNEQLAKRKKAYKKRDARFENEVGSAVDFGILALNERLKATDDITPLLSTRKTAPALLPACLDTLVQTCPTPAPDVDVSVFLHGAEAAASSDVQIAWRADLLPGDEVHWPEIVSVLPPRSAETISVPLPAVRAWLLKQPSPQIADVEGVSVVELGESDGRTAIRGACRWGGKERTEVVPPKNILPGDTIVVPALYGGCDSFGWKPDEPAPVRDIGDFIERGRVSLRLFAERFTGMSPEIVAAWRRFVQAQEKEDELAGEDALVGLLSELADSEAEPTPGGTTALGDIVAQRERRSLRVCAAELLKVRRALLPYPRDMLTNFLLLTRGPKTRPALYAAFEVEPEPTEEDDDGSRQERPVFLDAHLAGVAKKVEEFARLCCISGELRHDLVLAARLHDVGKADPRFQTLLHGGDTMLALLAIHAGKPLAKSNLLPRDRAGYIAARKRSGLPAGGRHELISVGLLRENPGLLDGESQFARNDPALIAHLVGTHHGYGRPFVPVVESENEVAVKLKSPPLAGNSRHGLESLTSGWTDQFWTLVQRYGYWGICYLEATLRIADHRQSQEEQDA